MAPWSKLSSTRKIKDPAVLAHRVTLQGSESCILLDPLCIGEKAEEDLASTPTIKARLFNA